MGSVYLDISMSLDGLIAQPNHDPGTIHDWLFSGDTTNSQNGMFKTSGASTDVLEETLAASGAVVAGRRTYDLTGGWGGSQPMGVPVFVVTHEARTEVPEGETPFTFVSDGVESAIEQAKGAAGDKDVCVMGGASLAQQTLEAGLLDEIQIHLTPVLLGDGIRLFDESGDQIELKATRVVEAPGVTHLRFRVVK